VGWGEYVSASRSDSPGRLIFWVERDSLTNVEINKGNGGSNPVENRTRFGGEVETKGGRSRASEQTDGGGRKKPNQRPGVRS